MSDNNFIKITIAQAIDLVTDVVKVGRVPMLHGSPGLGKSAVAAAVAKKFNLKLIDIRLVQSDPTDMNGFPAIVDGKATYITFDTFPTAGTPLPIKTAEVKDSTGNITKPAEHYAGWLIIYDELNQADQSTQAAAYKVILDRKVGTKKLHANCIQMAAGNLASDNAITEEMGTALQSRMTHLVVRSDINGWISWAENVGIDPRIIAYIRFKGITTLNNFNPNHTDLTFACERTWEMLSDIISPMKSITADKKALLAGTVGIGIANEFYNFMRIALPSDNDILYSPHSVNISGRPEVCYALSAKLSQLLCEHKDNAAHISAIIQVASKMALELQVCCIRPAYVKYPKIVANPEIQNWLYTHAPDLI